MAYKCIHYTTDFGDFGANGLAGLENMVIHLSSFAGELLAKVKLQDVCCCSEKQQSSLPCFYSLASHFFLKI